MEDDSDDIRQQIFHNTVRENVIFLLLFLLLYLISYAIIGKYRRNDNEDYLSTDEDEATVYKTSLWLCTFSLSISVCATLLLPFSIVSNEILLLYPSSYYVKWLNHSLIQGLWNLVFLFSNLSLFIFLPFAYLFTESEGFSGYRKGVMSRICETSVVLVLLGIAMLGLTYIFSNVIDKDKSSIHSLLNLWSYYLPFLYSCISFLGVVTLLLCTPLGFAHLFGIVSGSLVKPQFLRDLNEEYFVAKMEENCLRRRLQQATATGKTYLSPPPMFIPSSVKRHGSLDLSNINLDDDNDDDILMVLRNGALQASLGERLSQVIQRRMILDKQRQMSLLRRNILYPLAMLTLLAVTVITVAMVVRNTIELLIGIKALPLSTRQFTLGISSLSKLGLIGASVEVMMIFYLAITSCVGLYSLPLLRHVRPCTNKTPLDHIIINCKLLLILSSALPVLARILGITNFDLLGDFGQIEWLGNFQVVLLYNIVFVVTATLCLFNKFTGTVRRELIARLQSLFSIFTVMGNSQHALHLRPTPTHSGKED
ncbi:LMBR1-like protein lilipod [Lycorma delicatula]|uniref:LMBR1-like protein lilipod n=1 Tax=Lycorma delicatula TaxID=130591 RepID=UPI003F51707A